MILKRQYDGWFINLEIAKQVASDEYGIKKNVWKNRGFYELLVAEKVKKLYFWKGIEFCVNYNLWLGPNLILVPIIYGGPYNVIFNGTVTIPK